MQEKYYVIEDICVCCGRPVIPGAMICSVCQAISEGYNDGNILLREDFKNDEPTKPLLPESARKNVKKSIKKHTSNIQKRIRKIVWK